MPVITEVLRPFWMPGINAVSGRPRHGLGDWFTERSYLVHGSVAGDSFVLALHDPCGLVAAFAADCGRLGAAALESLCEIEQRTHSPKACAWLFIRAYYSAYFAAHSLLRMCGTSVSHLEADHTTSVLKVASLFGSPSVVPLQSGTYECTYDHRTKRLACTKQTVSGLGVHEALWAVFLRHVRRLSSEILGHAGGSAWIQPVAEKLVTLAEGLCFGGKNGGNWLSHIRNQINYRQAIGAWFPYSEGGRRDSYNSILRKWNTDPMMVELRAHTGRDPHRFIATCTFLVSLCHAMMVDMAGRCPEGRSFLDYGPRAYLNRIAVA